MDSSKNGEADSKKAKLEGLSESVYLKILHTFRLQRVLSEDGHQKNIYVHGTVLVDEQVGEEDVILILERTPLTEPLVKEIVCDTTDFSVLFNNDVYSSLQLYPKVQAGAMKGTVIYPASQKHLSKYESHAILLIRETASDYQRITLPHLHSSSFSLQWLYNVLEGKTEKDRVVLRHEHAVTGFVLIEDLKWDGKQNNNLYLVAIPTRRDILSIRELRACHLALLRNIRKKSKAAIKAKYNFDARQLRAYLHYQPSYYHLHVHFANVTYESTSCSLGKAHLLDDVIDRLEEDDLHFAKTALTFVAKDNDPLVSKFKLAGRLGEEEEEKEVEEVEKVEEEEEGRSGIDASRM